MQTLQVIVGYSALIIAILIAIAGSVHETEKMGAERVVAIPAYFAGIFVACYLVLLLAAGGFWVFAEIGVWVRRIAQWLLEAAFIPVRHLFGW